MTICKALCCPIWCPANVYPHKPTLRLMSMLIGKDSSCCTVTQSAKWKKQQQLVFVHSFDILLINGLFPISLGFLNITLALFSIWLLGFLEPEVGLWTVTWLCCQCRPLGFQLQAPSAWDRPSLACGLLCLVKTPAYWSGALAARLGLDLVLAPVEVSLFFFQPLSISYFLDNSIVHLKRCL